jgi:peptidoglycan hydrolase-like protein with peptidoglycan-binding domain
MPHDGYFWTETEASIRDFQSKNSLFASGVADKATLQALIK